MTLLEQLNKDMVVSMKNKDSFSLGVIRMAKGAIQLEAINKKKDLTDEDIVMVISKQIKMRNDSIQEFTKAGRLDLVEQNQKEIEVLNKKVTKIEALTLQVTLLSFDTGKYIVKKVNIKQERVVE